MCNAIENGPIFLSGKNIWLGGKDLETGGRWVLESTNHLFSYSRWVLVQPIICSHTVVGLRQMDSRLILLTRADFIFTPISTLNWTTGSVMMNIFTFVHRVVWKILRVIFMISFLNFFYVLFFFLSVNICEIWLFLRYILIHVRV